MRRRGVATTLAAGLLAASCVGDIETARPDLRRSADLARPPSDAGAEAPADLEDRSGPPYPIVLVHGMGGFRKVGAIDYFYKVPDALRQSGHDVWVSQQDPINDSEVRGPEVQAFVEKVLAQTGKAKVNLIGHSQGGFAVRFVASRIGDRVASVVTLASPMKGTPAADVATSGGPGAQQAIASLLDLYGALNGYDSNARAQIARLSSKGAADFFARHPDDPRVAYFSITGRSAGSNGDTECSSPKSPLFISRFEVVLDSIDPVLAVPSGILEGLKPKPVHDGLVTVASARHGTFLGCVPADHMDEVNQLLGDAPGAKNTFDALRFYRDLAAWLVENGY
ncbi:MAG: triacylglycerol lipase [Myxococcales bacterium]|nr:triacylglycerol lipase [Myxococcales bacterium]